MKLGGVCAKGRVWYTKRNKRWLWGKKIRKLSQSQKQQFLWARIMTDIRGGDASQSMKNPLAIIKSRFNVDFSLTFYN